MQHVEEVSVVSKKVYVVYGSEYACDGVYVPREILRTTSKRKAYRRAEEVEMVQEYVYKEVWVEEY